MNMRPNVSSELKVLLIALMIAALGGSQVSAEPPRRGAWLFQQVTFDGKISSHTEWSDADYIDMKWGLGIPPRQPYVNARVWVKNDDTWLYVLYRVEWPAEDTDLEDCAQISRYWGRYVPPWDYADLGLVSYGGDSRDAYGWDDEKWYSDTDAQGRLNVVGEASCDGTYYWFEMKKELSSGDGYDWSLVPGVTYRFLIGIWDHSLKSEYHADLLIHISTSR